MAGPDFSIRLGLVGHAQVIQGIESAMRMVGQLARKIAELSKEAQAYRRVVESHTVSVREADQATDSLIDTLELHRGAAVLEAAQMRVSERELRAIAVASVDLAQRTGTDATQAYTQLTRALRTAASEGLAPLGVRMEGVTGTQNRQREAIRQLTERYGEQTRAAQDMGDEIYRLQNTWGTAWSEMLLSLERNAGPMRTIIRELTAELQDVATAFEAQRVAQERMSRMGTVSRQMEIERELRGMGIDPRTGDDISGEQSEYTGVERLLRHQYRRARGAVGAIGRGDVGGYVEETARSTLLGLLPGRPAAENERIAQLLDQLAALERADVEEIASGEAPVIRPPAERPQQPEDAPTRRGGGRGSRAESEWAALERQAREAEEWRAAIEREGELATEALDREYEVQEKAHAELMRVHQENEERLAEATEEANRRKVASIEEYRQRLEKTREDQQETINDLGNIASAMNMLGKTAETVGGIMTAVAGEEGRATEVIKGIKGAFLVAENVVLGATEVAKAVASAASQDYGNAALHGIAAALHFAAAAKAGVELGTGGGSASAGSGASAAAVSRPEQTGPYSRERNEQRQVVVTFSGPVTTQRTRDDLAAMERESSRNAA
jgi:hypothetical protein